MKRRRSDLDPRADGLLPAPPCWFLLPSHCVGAIFRNMQTASSHSAAFALCGVCVCVCWCAPPPPAPSVTELTSGPRRLRHLGPHGALIPGWVTHGSDALSSPAPPPPSSLHGDASAGTAACTLRSWGSRPTVELHLFADCPDWMWSRCWRRWLSGGGGFFFFFFHPCEAFLDTCGGGMMAHLR